MAMCEGFSGDEESADFLHGVPTKKAGLWPSWGLVVKDVIGWSVSNAREGDEGMCCL